MAAVVLSRLSAHTRRILSSAPFTKYLLATNIVASVAIDACGDIIAQKLVEKSKSIDWQRNRRMMTVSMVLSIPNHYWYVNLLDKWFPLSSRQHVVKKVLLDTFVGGPIFFSAFYLGMSKLEGCTWRESVDEIKQKFIPTFMVLAMCLECSLYLTHTHTSCSLKLLFGH